MLTAHQRVTTSSNKTGQCLCVLSSEHQVLFYHCDRVGRSQTEGHPHHHVRRRPSAPPQSAHLQLRSDSQPATSSADMEGQVEEDISSLEQTEETETMEATLSSTSSASVSCDLETVTETCTVKEFSEESHCGEEATKVLEQDETIEHVNVTNSVVQVSEVNLMINAQGNQEKLDILHEKVSFEMAGKSKETMSEGQVTIGLYKEEVFMTAIEEIVVLTNEKVNHTTESAEKTTMNSEEVVETILIDETQEVDRSSKEENLDNEETEVEAENGLDSANISQYFSAENTLNLSQDFDCTEETAWEFSKQITSEAETLSSGHKQVESVVVTSVSETASETKTSTVSQHEITRELEVKLTFLKRFIEVSN